MGTKNLLPLALIRRMDIETGFDEEDGPGEGEEGDKAANAEDEVKPTHHKADNVPKKWSPQEPPSRRYVFTMPQGARRVADLDGVLCIQPTRIREKKAAFSDVLPPAPTGAEPPLPAGPPPSH